MPIRHQYIVVVNTGSLEVHNFEAKIQTTIKYDHIQPAFTFRLDFALFCCPIDRSILDLKIQGGQKYGHIYPYNFTNI